MKNPELKLPEKWRAKVEDWKPLLLVVARLLLVLGGGWGGANLMVGSTQHEAEAQAVRAKTLESAATLENLRQGVLQRIDVEERERNEAIAQLRERFAALEAKCNR